MVAATEPPTAARAARLAGYVHPRPRSGAAVSAGRRDARRAGTRAHLAGARRRRDRRGDVRRCRCRWSRRVATSSRSASRSSASRAGCWRRLRIRWRRGSSRRRLGVGAGTRSRPGRLGARACGAAIRLPAPQSCWQQSRSSRASDRPRARCRAWRRAPASSRVAAVASAARGRCGGETRRRRVRGRSVAACAPDHRLHRRDDAVRNVVRVARATTARAIATRSPSRSMMAPIRRTR